MPFPATLEDKEAIESQIIAALSDDPKLTMADAAKAAGISRSRLYRTLDANPGMAERIKQARSIARRCVTEDVEQSLVDRALDVKNLGGTTAAIFLLKGLRPDTYGERRQPGLGTVNVFIDKAQIALAQSSAANIEQLGVREDDFEDIDSHGLVKQ